jgi:hypothetical protein
MAPRRSDLSTRSPCERGAAVVVHSEQEALADSLAATHRFRWVLGVERENLHGLFFTAQLLELGRTRTAEVGSAGAESEKAAEGREGETHGKRSSAEVDGSYAQPALGEQLLRAEFGVNLRPRESVQ